MDSLISEEYKELNKQLHKKRKDYGPGKPNKWLSKVKELKSKYKVKSFLEYGCGKGKLIEHLNKTSILPAKGYDPCVKKYSELPEPADLVLCVDVLEHVEEDKILSVLKHIESLTNKVCFILVELKESNKTLADGRNAHILIKPKDWWFRTLTEIFPDCKLETANGKVTCLYEK